MLADLDGIAQSLARRVSRAVAIDDPSLRLLVHTPHHGSVDECRRQSIMYLRAEAAVVEWALGIVATAPEDLVRLPENPHLGVVSRVCAPLRWQGRTLGYLWLIDEDYSLTDEQLAAIADAARAAARVMGRGGLPADSEQLLLGSLTEDLFLEASTIRAQAAHTLGGMLDFSGQVCTLALALDHPCPPAQATPLQLHLQRTASRHSGRPVLTALTDDYALLVLSLDDGRPGLAARVADGLLAAAPQHGLPVPVLAGIGGPVGGLTEAWRSREQACATLAVVRATGAFGTSATWADLGVYQMLTLLPPEADLADLLPPQLWEALQDPAQADIVSTVEVYLDHGSDVHGAIAALNIHRTSLYYRLRRFTEITGLDLRDGRVRTAVHTGLAMARLRRGSSGLRHE
ncbi:PucR family transcriptional regulator [Ornithinimicrobium cavernae]|uniref:PucR family transcriptional regulator n=1 Tax=Ornithinimicrobium cavernae TaxID=2666047 RepID=UPI000D694DE0|nr:helix-turn-helix domain-containing protein [Ornithinimicrobium cavernae]